MPIPHKHSDDFFIQSIYMFYIRNENEAVIEDYEDETIFFDHMHYYEHADHFSRVDASYKKRFFIDTPGFTDEIDNSDIRFINNIKNYLVILSLLEKETRQPQLFDLYQCLMKVILKEKLDLKHFKFTRLECNSYSIIIE